MTFADYYLRLKKARLRVRSKRNREVDNVFKQSRGATDKTRHDIGTKNYINTPPVQNPSTVTPGD